jgi:hypothetical protein
MVSGDTITSARTGDASSNCVFSQLKPDTGSQTISAFPIEPPQQVVSCQLVKHLRLHLRQEQRSRRLQVGCTGKQVAQVGDQVASVANRAGTKVLHQAVNMRVHNIHALTMGSKVNETTKPLQKEYAVTNHDTPRFIDTFVRPHRLTQ